MVTNAFPNTPSTFMCFIVKDTKEISVIFDIERNSSAHEENLILLCKYNLYIFEIKIKLCSLFFILYSPLSIPEIHQGGYRICHDNNKLNTESYMTAQHIHYNSNL